MGERETRQQWYRRLLDNKVLAVFLIFAEWLVIDNLLGIIPNVILRENAHTLWGQAAGALYSVVLALGFYFLHRLLMNDEIVALWEGKCHKRVARHAR